MMTTNDGLPMGDLPACGHACCDDQPDEPHTHMVDPEACAQCIRRKRKVTTNDGPADG